MKPAKYRVDEPVICDFVMGRITEVVNGNLRGWLNEWYYLLQPSKFWLAPHWVRESEIKHDYRHVEHYNRPNPPA